MVAAPVRADSALPSRQPEAPGPLSSALTIVGDRWSLAIVGQLAQGPHRFNDLADALVPIARTVLSDRLRRLCDARIVARRQYSESPARWNYRLTVAGADLARVAGVLADWGSRHLLDEGAALRHDRCGGDVAPGYTCVACGPVAARAVVST